MTQTQIDSPTILTITDKAKANVLAARESEPNPESLALWLDVSGVANGQYTYDMWLQPLADAGESHTIQYGDEISVVVPTEAVDKFKGSTLDLSKDLIEPGMIINNPNTPTIPGMGDIPVDLSSEIAQKLIKIIDEQVNPAIAAHGGAASLVGVDEGTAYVQLSGGCQGCAMSRATLTQGIQSVIEGALPEIKKVVDVTDHTSGENPYY